MTDLTPIICALTLGKCISPWKLDGEARTEKKINQPASLFLKYYCTSEHFFFD